MLFGAILAPNWTENFVSRFIVSRVTETERRVFENKKENILDFSHKKPSFFRVSRCVISAILSKVLRQSRSVLSRFLWRTAK